MTRMFAVVLLAVGLVIGGAAPDVARASGAAELSIDRPLFYPESISAGPGGALYVSSLVTGEIVRFAPGSSTPTTFVRDDVNVGTAGVMVDPLRGVLWACAVDITGATPSALRAFDLWSGKLQASYPMPDNGVCGDIVLAWGDVYVTDTLLGRIDRLTERWWRPDGGHLEMWSADPQFAGGGFPKINGIAFNGLRTLYTTNYTTGELFAVRIGLDGGAQRARRIVLGSELSFPDGIRSRGGFLYVAENGSGLSRINPRTGTRTLIDGSLDQPSSLVFVGDDIWITEGQILSLQTQGADPELRFEVVRLHAP